MSTPRIASGDEVVLAGPNVPYRVLGLETSGASAVLHLRTVDGQPWEAARDEGASGHLDAPEVADDPCPDCCGDPERDYDHREGCRRILPRGDPLEHLQYGPPWTPWPEPAS